MGRPAACRSGGRQRFGICARVRQVVTEEEPPGECSDGTSGFGLLGFGFLGFGFLGFGFLGLEVVRMSWRSSGRTSEPTGGWNSLGWNSLGWDSLAGANRRGPRPPARKLPSGQSGWRRGSVPPAFPAEEEPADPERSRIPLRLEGRRDCGSLLSRPTRSGIRIRNRTRMPAVAVFVVSGFVVSGLMMLGLGNKRQR